MRSLLLEVAISKVYPGTVHRWCKWHVLKKMKETLGPLYMKKSEFQAEFHEVVNHMLTDEFEMAWATLLDKYNMRKHSYKTQIYDIRKVGKTIFQGFFLCQDDDHTRQ